MRIVIFVLVSMIVGAIASPIAAETRGSDFTHSVELIHQNGVDFLRLEIRPDIGFLEGRFSSSLTDVDVTLGNSEPY